jgi:GNAT superfamily N-acetyltransferase
MSSVTRLEVIPFDGSHLPDAGSLLAERHRRHRVAEPVLSPQYEDAAEAQAAVAGAFAAENASGAVGVRNGRVVGYLLGAPKRADLWGANVWVESAGHAVEEPEDVRDLYAVAATRWVDEGARAHYVLVPAHDDALVGAWFRLAFGHQHTHAVRDVPTTPVVEPASVTVRRAHRRDIPLLAELELELPRHQGLAPTFSAVEVSSYDETVQEWEDDFDDPEFSNFVAEHHGRLVGSAVGCRLEKSSTHEGLALPENAGFLGFAAVFPDARGLGAGRALGEAVLDWSRTQQHACVVTDWRATNLLSSRAWPALGFRPTFLRLHRLLGH